MAEIKKTIKLEYVATGLEKISKEIEKVTKTGLNIDTKAISDAIQKLKESLGKATGDPANTSKIMTAYKEIVMLTKELGVKTITLFDEDTRITLLDIERQLEGVYSGLAKVDRLSKKTGESLKDIERGNLSSVTKADRGVAQNQASSGMELISPKGRGMTDGANFIGQYDQAIEKISQIQGIRTEILEKLKIGEALSETEIVHLDEILAKQNDIKITGEEFNKQAQNRAQILAKEPEELKKILTLRQGALETDKEKLEIERDALKLNKEQVSESAFLGDDEKIIDLITNLSNSIEKLTNTLLKENQKEMDKFIEGQEKIGKEAAKTTKEVKNQDTTFGKAAKQVFAYGTAFTFLKRIYKETLRTIKELDKAMTGMAVVTSMSRKETWALLGTFQDLAKQTGFTTTEISGMATEYFKQGRVLSDVITLTETAAKAARIAGISGAESIDYLTAAINGFGLAAAQAMEVSDKFAAIAAASASDYEELAVGLSKFAAQARIAGISIDFAMGMLAKGIETTREAPETIGTALKTVISRMRELTDFGKTLEDGMDLNRVDKALKAVGVSLTDNNGKFRDLESVLKEVGSKWSDLDTTQQASVAVALAGTRQQSRLISIMNDFDRTLELVEISQESAGATAAQHSEYMRGLEAATMKLTTSWQNFISTIANSEIIIGAINAISFGIGGITDVFEKMGPLLQGILIAIVALIVANTAYVAIKKALIALEGKELLLVTLLNAEKRAEFFNKIRLFVTEKLLNKERIKGNVQKTKELILGKLLNKEWWKSVGAKTAEFGIKIKNFLLDKMVNAQMKTAILLESIRQTGIWATTKALLASMGSTIASTFAWIGYWIAALGPAGIVVGALLLIAATTMIVIARTNASTEAAQKNNQELEKQNYNLKEQNKELTNLSKKIDEINNKPIKTEADLSAFDELQKKLEEFQEEKEITLIVRNKLTGDVDWDETNKAIQNYQNKQLIEYQKNLNKQEKNLRKLEKRSKRKGSSARKAQKAFEGAGGYGRLAEIERENILSGFEDQFSTNNQLALERYIQKMFEDGKEVTREEGLSFIRELESITNEINKAEENLGTQYKKFEEAFNNASTDEMRNALKETYPELHSLMIENAEIMNKHANIIDKMGLSVEELASIFEAAGDESNELMSKFNEVYDSLNGVPKHLRMAKALELIGEEFGNAAMMADLYNIALKRSLLDTAGEMDRLRSVGKNIQETQTKFLSGELKDVDFLDFVESHPELFTNKSLVDAFMRGEDISRLVKKDDRRNQMEEYRMQLQTAEKSLEKMRQSIGKYTIEEINAAEARVRSIELLMEYRGATRGMTVEQLKLNATIKGYKNLQDLGYESIEFQERILKGTVSLLDAEIRKTSNGISNLIRQTGEDYSQYYEIVDGVAIVTESYFDLSTASREDVDSFLESMNGYLDQYYEMYKNYSNQMIKLEETKAKEKIKIYEDYFKALDKLEDKRNKKETRESLVNQLKRLEGATDERSRKKALELKKELNKLDEDKQKDDIKEARTALTDSINNSVDALRETFEQGWLAFIGGDYSNAEDLGIAIASGFANSIPLFDEGENHLLESLISRDEEILISIGSEMENAVEELDNIKSLIENLDSNYSEAVRKQQIAQETKETIEQGTLYKKFQEGMTDSDRASIAEYFAITDTTSFSKLSDKQRRKLLEEELGKEGLKSVLKLLGKNNVDTATARRNAIEDIYNSGKQQEEWKSFLAEMELLEKQNDILDDDSEYSKTIAAYKETREKLIEDMEKQLSTVKALQEEYNIVYARWVESVTKLDELSADTYTASAKVVSAIEFLEEAIKAAGIKIYPPKSSDVPPPKIPNTPTGGGGGPGRHVMKYAKGGKVDYTGLAMVHGSKSNPEAFLSADQTRMFVSLRDTLQAVGSDGVSGIAIGSITISPQNLNDGQDWSKAGKMLAEELQAGLRRTGLSTNKKR